MSECPICGEKRVRFGETGFHSCHDPEHLEPNEEWCDFCGFTYMETGDINDYDKAIEQALEHIEVSIDTCDDEIKFWTDYKENKIPRLKKIDFDKWREEFGWVKDKDGHYTRNGDYWDAKNKLTEKNESKEGSPAVSNNL